MKPARSGVTVELDRRGASWRSVDGRVRLRHGRPWLGDEGILDRYEVTTVVRD